MIEWINNNKEWLFGGGGVVVVGIIIKALWIRISLTTGDSKQRRACVSYLPDFLLRRMFKPTSLEKLVNIDFRPRGDSIDMNFGELPSAKVWLQVINHSPFGIQLDVIAIEL